MTTLAAFVAGGLLGFLAACLMAAAGKPTPRP